MDDSTRPEHDGCPTEAIVGRGKEEIKVKFLSFNDESSSKSGLVDKLYFQFQLHRKQRILNLTGYIFLRMTF